MFLLLDEVFAVHREELEEHLVLFVYFLGVDVHYHLRLRVFILLDYLDVILSGSNLSSLKVLDEIVSIRCFVSRVKHVWCNLTGTMRVSLVTQVDNDC